MSDSGWPLMSNVAHKVLRDVATQAEKEEFAAQVGVPALDASGNLDVVLPDVTGTVPPLGELGRDFKGAVTIGDDVTNGGLPASGVINWGQVIAQATIEAGTEVKVAEITVPASMLESSPNLLSVEFEAVTDYGALTNQAVYWRPVHAGMTPTANTGYGASEAAPTSSVWSTASGGSSLVRSRAYYRGLDVAVIGWDYSIPGAALEGGQVTSSSQTIVGAIAQIGTPAAVTSGFPAVNDPATYGLTFELYVKLYKASAADASVWGTFNVHVHGL
jgi:hypothetical protein